MPKCCNIPPANRFFCRGHLQRSPRCKCVWPSGKLAAPGVSENKLLARRCRKLMGQRQNGKRQPPPDGPATERQATAAAGEVVAKAKLFQPRRQPHVVYALAERSPKDQRVQSIRQLRISQRLIEQGAKVEFPQQAARSIPAAVYCKKALASESLTPAAKRRPRGSR